MPRNTRTSVENSIKAHCPDIRPSDLRRARKLHMRRNMDELPTHDEALMLIKAITYQDETGDLAVGFRRAS